MANTPIFTLLCCFQFVIGLLMFVFGVVDRTKVKIYYSYILLPIWIGVLAVVAGLSGLLIGNQYLKRGYIGPNMVSGLRAINIVCAGVSFYALYCYGYIFASIAPFKQNSIPKLQTKEGITSVIMILSVAEMFCGIWLALFNKEGMFLGSTPPIQHQLPIQYNDMQNPPQHNVPTHNPTVFPGQQQQQQQAPRM